MEVCRHVNVYYFKQILLVKHKGWVFVDNYDIGNVDGEIIDTQYTQSFFFDEV